MSQTMCENCRNYVYDDESDCMICEMDLDEDEMRLFLAYALPVLRFLR